VKRILCLLPLLEDNNAWNVRIFLRSRPTLSIRQVFIEISNLIFRDFVLHEMISSEAKRLNMILLRF
jgi:hypothetical protein